MLLFWILSLPQSIMENLNIINSMTTQKLSDFHTPSQTKLLKNPSFLAAHACAVLFFSFLKEILAINFKFKLVCLKNEFSYMVSHLTKTFDGII